MKVTNSQKIPIKLWMQENSDLETGAWDQTKNLANFPFAYKHIAIMPDAHQGYGMPIGGILATKDVIVPNAVGVDIGCGMCAVKTSLKEVDRETLKKVMKEIRKTVPVGFKKHKNAQNEDLMPEPCGMVDWMERHNWDEARNSIIQKEYGNAQYQLGTLGGGNHFIEIQKGDDGFIWIMIHSGSRALGFKVAHHYNKVAQELNEKYKSSVPKSWELAFLPIDSEEGQNYIKEMNYCVEFALSNRKLMMERAKNALISVEYQDNPVTFDPMINIAHNYASLENHFGENVWVHRKGATLARKGTVGIVPGSQGTKSYIVEGKGNKESFESCSHGAGRLMSRSKARELLDVEAETKMLNDLGVIHSIRSSKDLDEAPSSYKDIKTVMDDQKDLINIRTELTPLGVIKG